MIMVTYLIFISTNYGFHVIQRTSDQFPNSKQLFHSFSLALYISIATFVICTNCGASPECGMMEQNYYVFSPRGPFSDLLILKYADGVILNIEE